MIEVVLDFETVSSCDLTECGSWRYSEDPTTFILCLAYKWRTPGEPWQTRWWEPGQEWGPLALLLPRKDVIWIAHNTGFEKAIWRNIMVPVHGFPGIQNSQWHDTMAVCAMKVLPLDLEHAATVMRLPMQKDTDGRRLTLGLSKVNKKGYQPPITPAIRQRVIQYCSQDIHAQANLHERLGYLPAGERKVWLLDQRINERGVKIDLDLVRKMQQIVDLASEPLAAEFRDLTGFGINQNVKVLQWVREKGVDLPNMQKETLAKVLGADIDGDEDDADYGIDPTDLPRLPGDVYRVLQIRQLIGSASIKKLAKMEACVCADGIARGTLQYHGAGPGRWSGRLLQPQNFPRGTIKLDGKAPDPDLVVSALMTGDPKYVEANIGPAVETVISALRHCLIARPGRRYVAGDFSGIQARAVLAVAGQHDKVEFMAKGDAVKKEGKKKEAEQFDVYIDMGSQIHGRPIDKEHDPQERQDGKNSVLGCGFGMGAKKFWMKYCPERELSFAQQVIDTYRKSWAPKVPFLWYGLENAAVRCVHSRQPQQCFCVEFALEDMWLTCRLPSGRKMYYFNPQPIRKAMPWDENDIRPGFTYQAKKMNVWKTIDAFGGQLTENVICGIEADLMRDSIFKCEANGLPVVMLVHDEIITEPLEKDADELALNQIMCDSPSWAKDLRIPIAIEGWSAERYRK